MTDSSLDDYPGHNFTSVSGVDRRTQTVRHENECSCGFGPYNWTTRGEDHRDHVLRAAKAEAWGEGYESAFSVGIADPDLANPYCEGSDD